MYGMNPAASTITARGPANETPIRVRTTKLTIASTVAITAVPRTYPPALRMASSPASRIRSRCHDPRVREPEVPGLVPVEEQVEAQEEAEHHDSGGFDERTDDRRRLLRQPSLGLLDGRGKCRGCVSRTGWRW